MAHFAELDENNKVLRVIVVDNSVLMDEHGEEDEAKGILFCHSLFGGRWLQTSYNEKFRGKYASEGDIYDPISAAFKSEELNNNELS